MARVLRITTLAFLAGALSLGCGGGADGAPSPAEASSRGADSPSAGPVQIQVPAPPASGAPATSDLQWVIDAALEDAARRTGIPATGLSVANAEAVVWADGSLGCARPGIAYTMALVPGYRVRIRAGEQLLDYHASRRGSMVLCPQGLSTAPLPAGTM